MANVQLDKTVKNLYDRLYRKGVNISKKDIEARVLEISATGDLTDEQKTQIVESFISQSETEDNQDSLPNFVESYDQTPVESSSLATTTPSAPDKPPASALSIAEAREIVFTQCEQLEIELKSSEIREIAKEIHETSLDAEAAVNYTITVLKQFITVQENRFTSSLTESMEELVSHAQKSFRRREATTVTAFGKIKEDLAAVRANYKRSIESHCGDIEHLTTGSLTK